MTINILKTESFSPLGPAIRKPVAEKPYIPEQVRQGVFKDQQGRFYTDIATPGVPQVPKPTSLPTLPTAPNCFNPGDRVVVIDGPSVKRFARWFEVGDTGVVEHSYQGGSVVRFDRDGKCWSANNNDLALSE